ncbi:RING finger and CHY zinc finger domain-containing protein [Verticillium alfalfae VaMs.102]|uniref:RING finger and CHY zinc finger domain-containing protein n=1 Tax=Verticillium alfalfae (strain VaMs.102 / ATCC MYA-4576 / FGSC 10136) TaxID=526221 RepID=C9SCU3_VERA1|nr:RING finger and CHY zinc finger domain-containing protein [Verticillium alfalfae VaMs.102]EEY16908.1 RING finger and CHY zinc finger domain-containing protein [Verticillium alfalfae VaMs.102]
MSSLVADFIINPVIRQARRLSEIGQRRNTPDEEPVNVADPRRSLAEHLAFLGFPQQNQHVNDPAPDQVNDNEAPLPEPSTPDQLQQPPSQIRHRPLRASTEPIAMPVITPRDIDPPTNTTTTTTSPLAAATISTDILDQVRRPDAIVQSPAAMLPYNYATPSPPQQAAVLVARGRWHGLTAKAFDRHSNPRWSARGREGPPPPPGLDGRLSSIADRGCPGDPATAEKFELSADDIKPTFVPARFPKDATPEIIEDILSQPQQLGCQHYARNVKLQCSTCDRWYTCRFCHDAAEKHALIRKDTRNMLCMVCACPQKAGEACVNCGEVSAHYYCNICKLWDNNPNKSIYHCSDCGICRRGRGLGKDFFHCKKCCACISISIQDSHKCIERSTDCDCPICGEYMFTSPRPVVFMVCGHSIHAKCYDQHMQSSYKCPICNRSLLNMQSQFRQLELSILSQPMPLELRNTRAVILCNDCSGKSTVPYHWLGLKCAICNSYNTAQIRLENSPFPEDATGHPPANPLTESTGSLGAVDMPGTPRRRHSSLTGVQLRHAAPLPDRLARSASPPLPPGLAVPVPEGTAVHDADDADDSDEDMLGLWGTRFHRSSDEEEDDVESLSDDAGGDDDDDDEVDDEEEEDDENEIVLFGHR